MALTQAIRQVLVLADTRIEPSPFVSEIDGGSGPIARYHPPPGRAAVRRLRPMFGRLTPTAHIEIARRRAELDHIATGAASHDPSQSPRPWSRISAS